jgi:hypothetical protein
MIRHNTGFCPRASLRVHPILRHSSRTLAIGHVRVLAAWLEDFTYGSPRQYPHNSQLPFARRTKTEKSAFRSAKRQRPVTPSRLRIPESSCVSSLKICYSLCDSMLSTAESHASVQSVIFNVSGLNFNSSLLDMFKRSFVSPRLDYSRSTLGLESVSHHARMSRSTFQTLWRP